VAARGAVTMYRVSLVCDGISSDEGLAVASDITAEFKNYRPHHLNVTCSYADGKLILVAENDFDPNGLALQDEFSDCLSACLPSGSVGHIIVASLAVI